MLWAVSQAVGIRPDVDPPAPRHGIRSVLSIPGLGGRGTGRLRPQGTRGRFADPSHVRHDQGGKGVKASYGIFVKYSKNAIESDT